MNLDTFQNLYPLFEIFCVFNVAFIISQTGEPKFHLILYHVVGLSDNLEARKESASSSTGRDSRHILRNAHNKYMVDFKKIEFDYTTEKRNILLQSNEFSNCCLIAFNTGIFYFLISGVFIPFGVSLYTMSTASVGSLLIQVLLFVIDHKHEEPYFNKTTVLLGSWIVLILGGSFIYLLFEICDLTGFCFSPDLFKFSFITMAASVILPTILYGFRGIKMFGKLKQRTQKRLKEILETLEEQERKVSSYEELLQSSLNKKIKELPTNDNEII